MFLHRNYTRSIASNSTHLKGSIDMLSNKLPFLPLAELKTGEHATLHGIDADREILCRLSSLGFTPGVEIEMMSNYGYGPLVVTVRGARVALGRQEAKRATVRRN